MGESLEGIFFGFSSGVSLISSFFTSTFGESASGKSDIRTFTSLLSGEEMSGLVNDGARLLRSNVKLRMQNLKYGDNKQSVCIPN